MIDAISTLFLPQLLQQPLVLPSDGLVIPVPFGDLTDQPLNSMRGYILLHYYKRRIRANHHIWIDSHPLKLNHELQGIVERGLDCLGVLRDALDQFAEQDCDELFVLGLPDELAYDLFEGCFIDQVRKLLQPDQVDDWQKRGQVSEIVDLALYLILQVGGQPAGHFLDLLQHLYPPTRWSLPAILVLGLPEACPFHYIIVILTGMQQLGSQGGFRVYPKRFFIVFQYTLIQMMTAILVNTFTPIAAYLSQIYHEDPLIVNMAGLLFVLMHPIFTFPAAYFIDTYGSRVGITIGCVLCMVGVTLRLFINQHFGLAIAGQVIAGIGRPFILNCQTKISSNWFTAETRGGVTQFLTLILNVSLVLGIFIPGFVFEGYKPNVDNLQQGKELAFRTMLIQAIMGYCCYTFNIIFQQSSPPTPPSDSVAKPKQPFSVAIPKLFANKDYLFMLLAFGCYFGIFNGLSVVLSFLIEPWFGGDDLPIAVGAVGGSPILSGIIGVIILGPIQRKSGLFKKWVVICMLGSCSAMVIFYPLMQTGSLFWTSFASAYNSFFLIPLVPIMLELGCELAFPVGEGAATGLLFAIGNLFGFFLGLLMSLIVQGESKGQTAAGIGFCFGVFLIGLGLVYFMKEHLNRRNYEKQSQQRRKSQLQSQRQSISLQDRDIPSSGNGVDRPLLTATNDENIL